MKAQEVCKYTIGTTDSMIGIGADGKILPWNADYSPYAGNPRTPGAMNQAPSHEMRKE